MPRRPTEYFPDCGPFLPTSGPDWRWQRALEIVSKRKQARIKRDGPEIVRAVRFIRASLKDFTGRQMQRLLKEEPSLCMAVKLATEDSRRQLELQCRVLARESAAEIAVELGLTEPIVETYCKQFFDVRERLDATTYIHQRVIGLSPDTCPSIEQLMLLSAFYHGPHAVDAWLDFLDHQAEAHDLTTDKGRRREAIELFIAAQQLVTDEETAFSLFKRARFLLEIRQEMFPTVSVAGVLAESVSEMLRKQPLTFEKTPKTDYVNREQPGNSASKRVFNRQTA